MLPSTESTAQAELVAAPQGVVAAKAGENQGEGRQGEPSPEAQLNTRITAARVGVRPGVGRRGTAVQQARGRRDTADPVDALAHFIGSELAAARLVPVHQVELVAVFAATSLPARVLVALPAAFTLILDWQQWWSMTGHHI